MKINKIEQNALMKQKLIEGKSEFEAGWEIARDQAFQVSLGKDLSKLQGENYILKLRIQKMEKLIKDLKKKKIAEGLQNNSNSLVNERLASVIHCQRILNYLQEKQGHANISTIKKDCLINSNTASTALIFCIKNNLVEKEIGGGMEFYKLKKIKQDVNG